MSASPVVYFIDDSATMREVIKIAFRRENIDVVACHDAASALDMMDRTAPDVVISDVIMPGRDGYDVCQSIKQHPRLGRIPVILMSGVVNKAVAERAFAVKADELIRKPFQPQDLITRVRYLLNGKGAARAEMPVATQAAAAAALSSIFQTAASGRPTIARTTLTVLPRQAATAAPPATTEAASVQTTTANDLAGAIPAAAGAAPRVPNPPGHGALDATKLRFELLRLQSQIKKLEAELRAEREYSRALEEHIKTLQEAE